MKRETFLDKEVGYKYTTEEIAITPEDVDTIYTFLGQRETIFTDDNFAKSLELNLQGKIVAGAFTLLMRGKLEATVGLAYDAVQLGMNDVKFISPAYVGNHLRLEGELLNKRTTSKGHVVVTWQWTVKNQDDTDIVTGVTTEMFAKSIAA